MDNNLKQRLTLSPRDVETMMMIAIRNKQVFGTFKDVLRFEHFSELDLKYAVVWQVALNHFEESGEMPSKKLLISETDAALYGDADTLSNVEVEDVGQFIEAAFDPAEWDRDVVEDSSYAKWATKRLKRYMEDRLAVKASREVHNRGRVAVDLPAALMKLHGEAQQIAGLAEEGDIEFLPSGWDADAGIDLFSTYIPFFDKFLGGGHAPGEVYGIMGPFGSCKTTLAIMLAVNGTRHAHAKQAKEDYNGYVFYVSFEARIKEMRLRALSYAAEVNRKSLQNMGAEGVKSLSTAKSLKKYEKKRFAKALSSDDKVLGEQGRIKRASKYLNSHFIGVDLTGYDAKRRNAGGGFVEEISRIIATELRRRGKNAKATLVVIDYVGAMAKRYLSAIGKDESFLRHYISGAGLRARNLIADQFDCPVWLIHQFSGEANRRSPGGRYHHTDAAEAKNFAENLDFSFVVGNLTDDGLGQIVATKHRREGAMPAEVIHVDGLFNTVTYPNKEYVVDPQTHSIKEKDLTTSTAGSLKKPKKGGKVVGDAQEEAAIKAINAKSPTLSGAKV